MIILQAAWWVLLLLALARNAMLMDTA